MNARPTYTKLRDFHRRFKVKSSVARGIGLATVTLNIALILIGFSIINGRYILQPGISLELPEAPFADGIVLMETTIVTVSRDGTLFCEDERTSLDQLKVSLNKAAQKGPNKTLLIEADKDTKFETLVEIYNQAQAAGIQKIMMATRVPNFTSATE